MAKYKHLRQHHEKDDVVDAEHDLEQREDQEREPGLKIGDQCHATADRLLGKTVDFFGLGRLALQQIVGAQSKVERQRR